MKFSLIVAAVSAQVCDEWSDCAETECCGIATPDDATAGTEQMTCNDAEAVTWGDEDFNSYTFECMEEGANSLKAVVASAFVMATLYMS